MAKLSPATGDVQRTARIPATRCRPWERDEIEAAARAARVTLAEFIREAAVEKARQTLNPAA